MVTPLFRTTLREIRQSLGRFMAILAIVGLGVGFFAGLRMCQPSMLATGIKYLETYHLHDFRLLSTLGFTEEDVAAFAALDGVETARGSVYAEFLWQKAEDEEVVLMAHSRTEGINEPELIAGRLPQRPSECLADASYFTEADIGTTIQVSPANDQDTLDLLRYETYTIVGLARSPLYLHFERGTASIGSGNVDAFLLLEEGGFDFEAYYEIYLGMEDPATAYSDAYTAQADALEVQVEQLLDQRAALRYETLHADALEEIREGEQELSDGWEEYRTERTDAEAELADAYRELLDGEEEYQKGLADYEQGKIDYAEGLADYEQGKIDYAEGLAEYQDGLADYEQGKIDYAEGLAEYEDGLAELQKAEKELSDAKKKLESARDQLSDAREELDRGEESYEQLSSLYASAVYIAQSAGMEDPGTLMRLLSSGMLPALNEAVDQALQAQGSSLDEFLGGWQAAEEAIGQDLDETYLAELRETLDKGQASYSSGRAKYRRGLQEYKDGLAEFEEGKAELEEARIELEDAAQELADAEIELADAKQELEDAAQELADAEVELSDAKADLEKAPGELADARRELDDGWQEYREGLAEAEAEFADAEEDLADGQQEIDDAYLKLADLKAADTYILTRNENTGYASFDNDTAIVAAISVVFPVFFFLVAALVCMTTMKRMVEEQRTQIGVLKALGYSRQQIIGKYLFYSGSAAITGSILGYAIGNRGLPLVIWEIYGIMYDFAPLEFVFDPALALVSFAAALLCSMGATYASCRAELSRPAAELLRPKAPKAGKRILLERITPLWRRLSFLRKVSLRNVFRYRSRLIMMLLGIGGCTALLVTGFGIRDSIGSLAEDQYQKITLYDYAVNFQDPQTPETADAYLTGLGWEAEEGILVHSGSTDAVSGGKSKSVYLVIPAEGSLEGFISLRSGERAIPFPGTGEAVISTGLARDLAVEVGDTISLQDHDLGTVEVTVADICENYIFNYVYTAPETYEAQLGTVPAFKTLLVQGREGADPYAESVLLAGGEDVSSVTVSDATRQRVSGMLERLDILVVVVVACAAALAFIVLYNLTNINITERIREIATIKVLGFYQKEVAVYVFREITMLSFAGSLVGLLMGKALHAFVMAQVKVDGMFFPVRISPGSYAVSLLLTLLFTLLITWGMQPRLKKIDMAESLKSIE